MIYYLFTEPGCIPGIPGTFASCRVDVADDGTTTTSPLAQHHSFEPASTDAPTADDTATAPVEHEEPGKTEPQMQAESETKETASEQA